MEKGFTLQNQSTRGILTEIHIADLHFGAFDPAIQYQILQEQFISRIAPYNFDILSIDGDIFDHKLMANSDSVMFASKFVDDCVVRSIATVTGLSWDEVFLELSIEAYIAKDKLDANYVWGNWLTTHGFTKHRLPDTCPLCYSVRDFVRDHKKGLFILGDGTLAIAVVDGYYVDTFDSGDRTVLFYFEKNED